MKFGRKMTALTLAMLFMFMLVISSIAQEKQIMPRYDSEPTTTFSIDSDGLATMTYVCKGVEGVTTRIEISSQIQKRHFGGGMMWTAVAISLKKIAMNVLFGILSN